jgi:hypothetical protein
MNHKFNDTFYFQVHSSLAQRNSFYLYPDTRGYFYKVKEISSQRDHKKVGEI